jgi:mannose-6-phosphate isomerase-like protein (cupin superfamily)
MKEANRSKHELRKPYLVWAVFVGLSAVLTTASGESNEHRMVRAAGAQAVVIEGPMNQAVPFTVRIKFPENYKLPAHWHPAVERVTVLSGEFNMGTGDNLDERQTHPLGPGDMMVMQPKTHHFAWTSRETVVQLHGTGPWGITYVNPDDDPRKKP